MKTVTSRLMELDKTLELHNEGDWKNPVNKNITGFTSFNDAGLETEVGEFIYGLLRVLKPSKVLETGTHVGVGASYLGTALKDNNGGHLDTVEFLIENYNQAVKRMKDMELNDFVTVHFGDVKDFKPTGKYDFILLDTEPQTRFAEFEKFYPFLKEGGFIFIHDLHRHMHQIPNLEHGFAWPFGLIPDFITDRVLERSVRPFHLPTPRGLTGFYKVSSADYHWKK